MRPRSLVLARDWARHSPSGAPAGVSRTRSVWPRSRSGLPAVSPSASTRSPLIGSVAEWAICPARPGGTPDISPARALAAFLADRLRQPAALAGRARSGASVLRHRHRESGKKLIEPGGTGRPKHRSAVVAGDDERRGARDICLGCALRRGCHIDVRPFELRHYGLRLREHPARRPAGPAERRTEQGYMHPRINTAGL